MMGGIIVVSERTVETSGEPAVESMRLPLDLQGDDEARRERRMVQVRCYREHCDARRNGKQWWFRTSVDRHGRGPGDSSDAE